MRPYNEHENVRDARHITILVLRTRALHVQNYKLGPM